jgi:hypothetical protein
VAAGVDKLREAPMIPDTDLFGQPITAPAPLPPGVKGRRKTVLNGYAALPGTGPVGETCRSCKHYAHVKYAKVYRKCALIEKRWTNGPGTDILARSPACHYWEKP